MQKLVRDARRYMILNINTLDCMSAREIAMYDGYKNSKSSDSRREENKQELMKEVGSFSGTRTVMDKRILFDGRPKLEKMIVRFEDECARQSEDFLYTENNLQEIPFLWEIVLLDCLEMNFVEGVGGGYHSIILKQVVENGLFIHGKKYTVYSSSANQQKNKQVCLLQEDFWTQYRNRFMCGLTVERINQNGGCNTGKYLAYTSLIFSKSVETLTSIDIDEVLVLPEFETEVFERVNYLDMEHLTSEEREMSVPVNHMDGAGMFLPGTLPCSCQIRGGWIKGAVFPFDFRKFIIEMQENGKIENDFLVKDVWGTEYPIDFVRDHVKMILNGSQLKMWKYYDSWKEYRQHFKKNNLAICINNVMHYKEAVDPMVPASYQFFQTIPRENITEESIEKISKLTIDHIQNGKKNPEIVLRMMGFNLDSEEPELPPLYAAIRSYPQLLETPYVQSRFRKKMESIRDNAMAGKLYIRGFYNYICPDLYAACEHWFCGVKEPEGLIPKNHVYNAKYAEFEDILEVCCLRSPHLSDCEHGIRRLVRSDECKKWFYGNDTVISTHDLLTKILQCDVDGDEMLLTPDKTFIDLLDRTKLPLYYEMQKGGAEVISADNIYNCLMRSFGNSVIGEISNTLTKYLNIAEKPDMNFVRILTAYNNFCIDYPKSQYMPKLGDYQYLYDYWKKEKYPKFFMAAKDAKKDKCRIDKKEVERSNVNRIAQYVRKKTIGWDKADYEIQTQDGVTMEPFNQKYLKFTDITVNRDSELYRNLRTLLIQLKRKQRSSFTKKLNEKYKTDKRGTERFGYDLFYAYCDHEFIRIAKDNYKKPVQKDLDRIVTAYLVDIEYFNEVHEKEDKDILWNCYGDIIYKNLLVNLEKCTGTGMKASRFAYKKREEKEKAIQQKIADTAKEIEKREKVSISEAELDWINNIACRKGSERDRYILYLLMVAHKRHKLYLSTLQPEEEIKERCMQYFKIYKNKRDGSLTVNTIDQWVNADITKKALERLEKKNHIKIEKCSDHMKVYICYPKNILSDIQVAFETQEYNPMIDYYEHSGEAKIKKCEICGKKFIVVGNQKTCSSSCSRYLELNR